METSGTENFGSVEAFDTLAIVHSLEEKGVEREQAEAHAEVLRRLIVSNLATKTDLARVEAALKTDIEGLRKELKTDIANVKVDLMKTIIGWIIGAVIVQSGLIAALKILG